MAITSYPVATPTPSSANIGSLSATLTSAVPLGDLIYLSLSLGALSPTTAVSDSKGNPWTKLASATAATTTQTVEIWYTVTTVALTTSDTITVTRSPTGGILWTARGFSGIDRTTPFGTPAVVGATASGGPSGGTVTVPPGGAGIMAFSYQTNMTFSSLNAGWTSRYSAVSTGTGNPRGLLVAEATETSTAGATAGITGYWAMISVAVNAVYAGASGTATSNSPAVTQAASGTFSAPITTNPTPTLAIIGDSLTEWSQGNASPPTREATTRAKMATAGYASSDTYWYGKSGKGLVAADSAGKTTMQNIADARAALGTVNVWVIALGTNNTSDSTATYAANMRQILNAIYVTGNENDRVVWVNLAFYSKTDTRSTTYNPVIASTIAEYSKASVLDWHAQIHQTGIYDTADWIYPTDGVHMTTQGFAKRDASIAAKITVTVTRGTTLAIIGDSLTERGSTVPAPPTRETETRLALSRAGFLTSDIYWYGKGGKGLSAADSAGKTTLQNIADARASLGTVNVWVIALGTNNATDDNTTFASKMNSILDVIYPTGTEPDKTYWVNLSAMNASNTNYVRLNPVIAATVAARATASQITVLDWNAYIHSPAVYSDADWLPADIPHMTVQGYAKRDAFISAAVTVGPVGSASRTIFIDGTERSLSISRWVDGVEIGQALESGFTPSVSNPGSTYPPYPAMIPGWVPMAQQIDTSRDQGWTQTSGVRTTDSAINRASNTQFGVGPDKDAMLITVTYDGTNYYASDAQARFIPLPSEHVVEYYCKVGPMGSGWFPAVWERPSGAGDGEIDWWEGRGKWYNTAPVGLHPNLFMINAITTLNGSYATKAQRPRPINITSPVIDVNQWHHYRHRLDATSMTTWIDGENKGEILRSSAGSITNAEWDRNFTGHDWYLRVTQQFGVGTNADTGGPADPSICPNELWIRDVRLYKRP